MELVVGVCVDHLSCPMDKMGENQDEKRKNIVPLQMRRDLARIDMTLLPQHAFTA